MSATPDPNNPVDNTQTVIIVCSVVGGAVLLGLIILTLFCVLKIKKKRRSEGKYSPSGNERKGGVQIYDISSALPPPPPERLI